MGSVSIFTVRTTIARSLIYICYAIYPIILLVLCLVLITKFILINATPDLVKFEQFKPWPLTLGFTAVVFITFTVITLLGMFGWLLSIGTSLTKQMTLIIQIYGSCTLLIFFGFILLLAGIGAFMILGAFTVPLMHLALGKNDFLQHLKTQYHPFNDR